LNLEEQQRIIEMGRNAEALKNNPALEACMSQTLEDLFVKWVSTGPEEYADRDQLWATAQALKAFKDTLDVFIEQGDFERKYKES
jgi:hypothetical protein